MKVHLRADKATGAHTTFTVFMNGGNCGQLTMKEEEAIHFHHMLLMTHYKGKNDIYISSGHWTKEAQENANIS